jgi:hypothetical protein
MKNEFHATALPRQPYQSHEEPRADAWITSQRAVRTHARNHYYGKTPIQTFLERVRLACQKSLDPTALTTD